MSLQLEKSEKYSYILKKPQLLINEFTDQVGKVNRIFNKIRPNLPESEAKQCTNFILGGVEHISFELADKVAELINDYIQLLKWNLDKNQAASFDYLFRKGRAEIPPLIEDEARPVQEVERGKYEPYGNIGNPTKESRNQSPMNIYEEKVNGRPGVRELRYERTDDEEESEIELEEIKFADIEEPRDAVEPYHPEVAPAEEIDPRAYDSEPKSQNLMESLNKISEQLKQINSKIGEPDFRKGKFEMVYFRL